MSATMAPSSQAETHWVVLKPIRIGYANHEVVVHQPNEFLRPEAADWSQQMIDQLREAGKIAPVAVPSDEWLLGEVSRRGLAAGGDVGGVAPEGSAPGANPTSALSEAAPEGNDGGPGAEFPKHLSGQSYELSDGSTVRGLRAARAGQSQIDQGS